jgi:hypothetical protein
MRRFVPFILLAAIHLAAAEPKYPYNTAIEAVPEALRLIRTADEVYILPVTLAENRKHFVEPLGDYKHLRRLDPVACRKLQRLLGAEKSWFHGGDNTISLDYSSRTVGFIFRKGKDKLVLLCGLGARFKGTFNGGETGGSLEFKQSDKLEKWKKQYAKPELSNET